MKTMKFVLPLVFLLGLFFPMALFAQEATPEAGSPLTILQALEIVRAAYGNDAIITEISFDSADDDDDNFEVDCWHFEFADGSELCVDALTGEIVIDDMSAEATPEATADTDDDDSNDDSDDDNGNDDDSDDNSVTVNPTLSLEEAIALALSIFPDSAVTDTDLEVWDDGRLVWDIELDDDVRSVDLDATTGEILDFGYEVDDDNGGDDDSNDDDRDDDNGGDDDSNDDDRDDDSNDDDNGGDDDSNDDDRDDDDHDDDNGGDDDSDDGDDD